MNPITLTPTDLARIAALSGPDLAALYQAVTNRLRADNRLESPNQNVLTVRLPVDVCDHLKRLAFHHRMTRSAVARQALIDFVRRNHA